MTLNLDLLATAYFAGAFFTFLTAKKYSSPKEWDFVIVTSVFWLPIFVVMFPVYLYKKEGYRLRNPFYRKDDDK